MSFMVALRSRCGHYIFATWFLSFFFFPCLISAVGDWMSTILPHMVWPCSANLECMYEICYTRLAENTGRKKSRQLSYLFNDVMTNTEWFVLKWFWPEKLTEATTNTADRQTTAMIQPMLANPHKGLWCHFVVITMATSFIWLFYFGVVMSYDGQITMNMASHELGFRH